MARLKPIWFYSSIIKLLFVIVNLFLILPVVSNVWTKGLCFGQAYLQYTTTRNKTPQPVAIKIIKSCQIL